MERYNPKPQEGLTKKQVENRINENLNYTDVSVPTKTIGRIVSDNFFTLFNFLNFGLALAIFLVGAYKNMLFIGTVIFNIIISTVQEIRAKKIVDKLGKDTLNIILDNPSSLYITDGMIVEKIKKHTDFKDIIKKIVNKYENYGDSFVYDSLIGNDFPLSFNSSDLFFAIHLANIRIVGKKDNDIWNLEVMISDTYDYKENNIKENYKDNHINIKG